MIKLKRNTLKFIAMFFMLLDHIAFMFFDEKSALYFGFRFLGKTSAILFAYLLVEGFEKTSSRKKQLLRLGLFMLISQVPFSLAFYNTWITLPFNVFYTLFLSYLLLLVLKNSNDILLKVMVSLIVVFLSYLGDWGIVLPLCVILMYYFKGDKKVLLGFNFVICLYYMLVRRMWFFGGIFISNLLLSGYIGQRGSSAKWQKWLFYIFYPLHLLILYLIKRYI